MSTFDGLVDEFPEIRIDYFRTHTGRKHPAACFLSHVHSDHLLGLESLKMPFVYCSAPTKQMLLRMEKYPHRINFQKGILELRRQTYQHLRSILRALPLEAPISLELTPRLTIQVTLFDANHCPGAVMFLIEGRGKAVLYTGDIRAEPWYVNSIARNPVLLPYIHGQRTLDCIYLDTTFASHDDIHRDFPTKAAGLAELLDKIKHCPLDSIYYFRAWTLGYEDVWLTLAKYLETRVHVDDYQFRLFSSLADDGTNRASALIGIQVGNNIHPGCLTTRSDVAIHSCEPGMECHAILQRSSKTVYIVPIISRARDGSELAELGAGGGRGDLYQSSELEMVEEAEMKLLDSFCSAFIKDKNLLEQLRNMLQRSKIGGISKVSLEGLGLNQDQETSLKQFVDFLSNNRSSVEASIHTGDHNHFQPRHQVIHFPYSRHSSYSELRHLISLFKPRDICPCTVDMTTWSEDVSMSSLFGDLCSEQYFIHDARTRRTVTQKGGAQALSSHQGQKRKRKTVDSQETESHDSQGQTSPTRLPGPLSERDFDQPASHVVHDMQPVGHSSPEIIVVDDDDNKSNDDADRLDDNIDNNVDDKAEHNENVSDTDVSDLSEVSIPNEAFDSQPSRLLSDKLPSRSRQRSNARRHAYQAAKTYLDNGNPDEWNDLHIRSMGWKGHTNEEPIL